MGADNPAKIAPRKSVAEEEKQAAATSSVWAAIFLSVIKLVVGLMTGSLGMLAEAAHSALDLVAAVVTFLAVHFSDRPADADHTYGHGKIENFSALIEALLLVVTCVWIVYEAIQRLFFHDVAVEANIWSFAVMLASIIINISRSRMLYATAKKHGSQALEADALHFQTDVWSSYVVLGGLALVWLGQNVDPAHEDLFTKADSIAALGVAVIVALVTYDLGKRTVDVLLDRAPTGITEQLSAAAAEVAGVLGVVQVRVRRSGATLFVDMIVAVDRNLSFEGTHALAEAVEARVQQVSPGADVVVHTDPQENDRENVAERCRAVASRYRVGVHNISVLDSEGALLVDLHLEVDDHLSLRQAHDLTRQLEGALRAENPAIKRVNTHIESRGTSTGNGRDVTEQEPELAVQILAIAEGYAGDHACHDVRLRLQDNGALAASLHCVFPADSPIPTVHDIATRIETHILETLPRVGRVLVHAEPLDAARPS